MHPKERSDSTSHCELEDFERKARNNLEQKAVRLCAEMKVRKTTSC